MIVFFFVFLSSFFLYKESSRALRVFNYSKGVSDVDGRMLDAGVGSSGCNGEKRSMLKHCLPVCLMMNLFNLPSLFPKNPKGYLMPFFFFLLHRTMEGI